MVATTIGVRRLWQQRLSQNPLATPGEVVSWLGAVQAQDFLGAKWALGVRTRDATDDAIERAFADGIILRTHVMRPTWHFVTPADIRWMLDLTAPRVNAANASMYRHLELDDALFQRSNAIIARALQDGQPLTRAELGSALAEAGIVAEGVRLGCLVQRAELDAIVCSGPRRGKQFTYALLDQRAPRARRLHRDEALAELTRRYFVGHGPATIRDFVWWSGLTVADAKLGVAMVGSQLTHESIDGQTYWFSTSTAPAAEPSSSVTLLPTYDEFLVGYRAFDQARMAGWSRSGTVRFFSTIVVGGQVVGSWRRILEKGAMVVELTPFESLGVADDDVAAAVRRYGEFVGMAAIVRRVGDRT